ncbi:SDR family NAD(P)-dependent oxidoreductase [Sphingobium algorifonticola]|uniref:SDR family NAD(P)-dependent oxidoreductase n=1 Tax=Sphingobium algorifonticola TaxID=2008318 RepID=A0A437JCL4_9SPHN|nr:SDR family NAD(P)-dependent oxidoreductase [Sphingobium algorifonticola]RVT43635.1 SDR family NAD(P)-dependent oxidoreductase [Sphingobium algorifonticola]
MTDMLIFGLGYTASRLAAALRAQGWRITATRQTAIDGALAFADSEAVRAAIGTASHILSSVPPGEDGADPVLAAYGADIAAAPARWTGYLSATGVYGDTGGAWVDESASIGHGRRSARAEADLAWQMLRDDVRVFRLPGIYGPGRSAIDRLIDGRARRIDLPGQVFSRVHVDDIVAGVIAGFDGPPGPYNLADDHPCSQNEVIAAASALTGLPLPPLLSLEEAKLSPMARAFYGENRRIANGKAKRLLGWNPACPTYREGLARIAMTMPRIESSAPSAASGDQR